MENRVFANFLSHYRNSRFAALIGALIGGLLLSSLSWSDVAHTPERAPMKRTFGSIPEYPELAVRYNVYGNVVARLYVNKDGQTVKTEILESPADLLSNVVTDATQDWQFINVPDDKGVTRVVTFPFVDKDSSSYPYDKKIRPSKKLPKTVSDAAIGSKDGWVEFRLLIDSDGNPAKYPETKGYDYLVLKSSIPEFKQVAPLIIAAMTFERSAANSASNLSRAMNRFKVTIAGEAIHIEQFSGD